MQYSSHTRRTRVWSLACRGGTTLAIDRRRPHRLSYSVHTSPATELIRGISFQMRSLRGMPRRPTCHTARRLTETCRQWIRPSASTLMGARTARTLSTQDIPGPK